MLKSIFKYSDNKIILLTIQHTQIINISLESLAIIGSNYYDSAYVLNINFAILCKCKRSVENIYKILLVVDNTLMGRYYPDVTKWTNNEFSASLSVLLNNAK